MLTVDDLERIAPNYMTRPQGLVDYINSLRSTIKQYREDNKEEIERTVKAMSEADRTGEAYNIAKGLELDLRGDPYDITPLAKLVTRVNTTAATVHRQAALLEAQDKYIKTLAAVTENLNAVCEGIVDNITSLSQEIAELRSKIQAQGVGRVVDTASTQTSINDLTISLQNLSDSLDIQSDIANNAQQIGQQSLQLHFEASLIRGKMIERINMLTRNVICHPELGDLDVKQVLPPSICGTNPGMDSTGSGEGGSGAGDSDGQETTTGRVVQDPIDTDEHSQPNE